MAPESADRPKLRIVPSAPATSPVGDGSAYQLKISLKNVKPPVWRRVQVAGSSTMAELHRVIQAAMGWSDSHLHEFEIGGTQYGEPDLDAPEELVDEATIQLSEVAGEGIRFEYVYDFGDDWRHDVVVEKVLPAGAVATLPVCVDGRRGCPPEDVGGPWAYDDFLAAYGDPAHPEHRELRGWVAAGFDPEHFDPAEVTQYLQAAGGTALE